MDCSIYRASGSKECARTSPSSGLPIVGASLLVLSACLIACANADNIPPLYQARTLLEQQQQAQAAEQLALYDFERGINPEWNVPIGGIYDQADRYRTATGFPLPGWRHMFFGR